MTQAGADDGGAHADLERYMSGNRRLQHWMHASDSARDKRSHGQPCKLRGRLREKPVCSKVQTALQRRTLDHGSDGESDTIVLESTPRHSSASNGLAERAIGEQLRTLQYDTWNRYEPPVTSSSAIWPWMF